MMMNLLTRHKLFDRAHWCFAPSHMANLFDVRTHMTYFFVGYYIQEHQLQPFNKNSNKTLIISVVGIEKSNLQHNVSSFQS